MVESPWLKAFKNLRRWHLGTRFDGGLASAGLMVGLEGFSKPRDSVILCLVIPSVPGAALGDGHEFANRSVLAQPWKLHQGQGHPCTSVPFSGFASSGDKLCQEVFPVAFQSVTVSLFQQPLCALKALAPKFHFHKGDCAKHPPSFIFVGRQNLKSTWDGMCFFEQRWETPQGTGMCPGNEQGGVGRPRGCTGGAWRVGIGNNHLGFPIPGVTGSQCSHQTAGRQEDNGFTPPEAGLDGILGKNASL